MADSLPIKYSPVNHRSGAGQGKSALQCCVSGAFIVTAPSVGLEFFKQIA